MSSTITKQELGEAAGGGGRVASSQATSGSLLLGEDFDETRCPGCVEQAKRAGDPFPEGEMSGETLGDQMLRALEELAIAAGPVATFPELRNALIDANAVIRLAKLVMR